MRKVILSMMSTVDGYIEGPGKEMDWSVWDSEMETYMLNFMRDLDLFIYGRKAYEVMNQYWPHVKDDPSFPDRNTEFVDRMNETPKLVLSRTLNQAEWNAQVLKDNIPEEIRRLKDQPGKDMALFAGAEAASTFIRHKLIDEYRIIVNPAVIGGGNSLFKNIGERISLKLLDARTFPSGIVILRYEPVPTQA